MTELPQAIGLIGQLTVALILVIDDESEFRATLADVLEDEGHMVIQAEDGQEGLRKFDETAPHLVITDILMPNKEGLGTIMEIKKRRPGVPIIAISGGGRMKRQEFLKIAESVGAAISLKKPFSISDLLISVSACLSSSGS